MIDLARALPYNFIHIGVEKEGSMIGRSAAAQKEAKQWISFFMDLILRSIH